MGCAECGRELGAPARTGRPRRYCSRSCQARAYRRRRDRGRLAAAVRRTPPEPRTDRMIAAALGLADAEGAEALTLRGVAHRAGLPLTAVQQTLGSRDRLVETLVQHVLSRRRPPAPPTGTPAQALARLAEHEWETYRAHPWLVGVLATTRPPLVPAVLDLARASVDAFVALGLDTATALRRYLSLSGYVQGMALLIRAEQQESARSGTTYRSWWGRETRRLDRTGGRLRHPWLDELTGDAAPDTFDADAAFRDGLGRVLAGLTGVGDR
ncbi:TetR/AcrR family transcriptional regulator C-terminal domain-containing protein [Solwaraspora sp. WMMD1047]|uniref:TetR/AcrR family transcriptional regulator C-terminal domain-containing protein n=1 Tax=Solwaraspora sp. WMMD1047 TaxID=3016102 RepID=UPI0024176BE1|nr:TetR/AcrR family transcriptional regulator C-terminal domain-containing protein [Solwaraspora sp. WMMD1047]MDG4830990.1 TetR/AcrR family transcriptional regulator C-terminal domain-containing protein [Solwaraspora sp. WMMD1047]